MRQLSSIWVIFGIISNPLPIFYGELLWWWNYRYNNNNKVYDEPQLRELNYNFNFPTDVWIVKNINDTKSYKYTEDDSNETISTKNPKFISKGGDVFAKENSTIHLPCDVDDLGQFVLLWRFNLNILFVRKHEVQGLPGVTADSDSNGITIRGLKKSHVGVYKCEVSTPTPSYIAYNVVMTSEPVIEPFPQDSNITIRKNERLVLHCNAKSVLKNMTYQWLHNNKPTDKVLTQFEIARVKPSDAGTVSCIVSNMVGQSRFDFNLNVQFEPQVTIKEKIVHGFVGDDVDVKCEVNAYPLAHITWYFSNNSVIHNSRKHVIRNHDHYSTLTIKNVGLKDYDIYSCHANNSIGSQNVNFEVTGKPSKPKFLSPPIAGTNYKLEWEVFSRSPIVSYNLRIREVLVQNDFEPSKWRSIPIEPIPDMNSVHKQSYFFDNLSQDSTYEVDLEAENEFGITKSDTFTFTTSDSEYGNRSPVLYVGWILMLTMLVSIFV